MKEPANPFYRLLLVASFAFALTALAHALVPWKEQPGWLRRHGWWILLAEMAAVIVLGLLSMILDRVRSLKKESGVQSPASEVRRADTEGANPLGESADPQ